MVVGPVRVDQREEGKQGEEQKTKKKLIRHPPDMHGACAYLVVRT